MAPFTERRNTAAQIVRFTSAIFAVFLFGFAVVAAISAFLVYQALHPAKNPSAPINLDVMMGHPASLTFSAPDGSAREGWFFPGLRGAPTIIVCHGYQSQRVHVLTLVTALQEHQFNVFTFDFRGHGTSPGVTTLGYREVGEAQAALKLLAGRDDVDPQRFGLWGVDMGGYAALEVAASDPRVSALAVDDAYADPKDMLQIQAGQSGLTVVPLVMKLSTFIFRLYNYTSRDDPPVTAKLSKITVPKLFIVSDDRPALATATISLFDSAPNPKRLLRDNQGYRDMSDDDRKAYESQLVSFFLQYMPPGEQR